MSPACLELTKNVEKIYCLLKCEQNLDKNEMWSREKTLKIWNRPLETGSRKILLMTKKSQYYISYRSNSFFPQNSLIFFHAWWYVRGGWEVQLGNAFYTSSKWYIYIHLHSEKKLVICYMGSFVVGHPAYWSIVLPLSRIKLLFV